MRAIPRRAAAGGPGGSRSEIFRPLSPLWSVYDTPYALARIQEAIRKLFDDDDHPGFYQFNLIVNAPGHPGRIVSVIRSPRLGHDMPLDVESLERTVTNWEWKDLVRLDTDPDLDPIRNEPRFREAVEVVKKRLAEEKKP